MKARTRYLPSIDEFLAKARRGNLVPVYREINADFDTPVTAFLKIRSKPCSFLLESAEGGDQWGRYSFLGTQPSVVVRGSRTRLEVTERGRKRVISPCEDPMGELRRIMSRYKPVEVEGLPRFSGGAVGYMGYDTVRSFELLPDFQKPGIEVPELFYLIADTLVIFDNFAQRIKVVSNADLTDVSPQEAYRKAIRKIDSVIKRIRKPLKSPPWRNHRRRMVDLEGSSNLKKGEFEKMVLRGKEYIRAGDIFQVVLSQRFETPIRCSPFNIYRALRMVNPSPYMYFFEMGGMAMAGSSPEILVRREDGDVELRPIAGTRPRGSTNDEDRALERELTSDEKERAEHIMLVDLGRNDMGRVSVTGSIRVDDLMAVERYSHVMHLVTHLTGQLKPGLDSFDVIRACFPAGTVSGAPKIRAMEIIEELEPTRRGPYAGAVGYFGFSGNMDTCINIRTIVVNRGRAYIQAGAGIVADSDPTAEYHETVNKARGMLAAIDLAERGQD